MACTAVSMVPCPVIMITWMWGLVFLISLRVSNAVDARHPDVHQHQVGGFGFDLLQCFVAVGGRGDLEPLVGEQARSDLKMEASSSTIKMVGNMQPILSLRGRRLLQAGSSMTNLAPWGWLSWTLIMPP